MHEHMARLEAVLALTLAAALVFLTPFRWTARLFGRVSPPGDKTSPPVDKNHLQRAQAVTRRLTRVADRLPWTSTCLVRALAGKMLLARRGVRGGAVRFGVAKCDGRLAAHAWLMFGGAVLIGGETAQEFKPLADLAA